ncbi:tail fiber domain-containing protein [Rufibacter sp. LB8]|uniref:tail fiber domain-containing protein n=2 Tax=Rufibacter sp. LB8 TaxID=2777781 RepID=UPI00178C42AF|nr:tail fiber domain-containing protein [Rufibacter sp. LB8]
MATMLLNSPAVFGQSTGVRIGGTPAASPDPSAMLDIAATDKGLLIPRLTETQRQAIASPATGLMVFQTDGTSVGFWYYVSTGGWTFLNPAGDGLGNHTLTQNLNTNGKEIRSGNYPGLSIASDGQVTIGTSNRNISGSDIDNNKLGLWLRNTDAGLTITGGIGYGFSSLPVTGAGDRLFYAPHYAAFRAGGVSADQWNTSNLGFYSTAFGYDVKAKGNYTFAAGYQAETYGAYSAAIGYLAKAQSAASMAIGYRVTASGDYSTALGYRVSTNGYAGSFIIGDQSTTFEATSEASNQMKMRFANGYKLYTNSAATVGAVLTANGNAWSTISDVNRKENFAPVNGEAFLQKIARFNLTSWNYKGQDSKTLRHYGPMAQDFHAAFGTDSFGTIGNDTTINQADFDCINLIAIQALEKRTAELQRENSLLKKQLSELAQDKPKTAAALKKENKLMKARFGQLESELTEIKALLQGSQSQAVQNAQPQAAPRNPTALI